MKADFSTGIDEIWFFLCLSCANRQMFFLFSVTGFNFLTELCNYGILNTEMLKEQRAEKRGNKLNGQHIIYDGCQLPDWPVCRHGCCGNAKHV